MPALTSNTLTRQVDIPTWEWTRFAPAVSSALSSTCSADNGNFMPEEHGRYIYYLISATQFFRYDTWTDMFQQLSNPAVAPVTFTAMKYSAALGIDGNVIAASSTTLTIPSVTMQSLKGYDVEIISGTGAGQVRTITGVAEPVAADSGIVTAVNNVAGALTITDTLKAFAVNQYAGYTLRITGNTGVSQIRRILSNAATVITLGDTTQTNEIWNNPAIFSPAINATAGTQATYSIESQVLTVDSAWTVTPDSTSVFKVKTGLVIMVSSAAAAPFFTMQAYDIISDTWYILPAMQGIFSAAGTDCSVERTTENSSIWERGIATGGSTTTLIDDSHGVDVASWKINQWANYWVYIYSGVGAGQIRQIASNTATTLTWTTVGTAPTSTSRYLIIGFDAGTATAGTSTTITDSTKSWAVDRWKNYAVRILAGTGAGQIRPIASNTSTAITIVGNWATNPDSTSIFSIQGDPNKIYLQLGGIAGLPIYNIDSQVPTFGRQQDFGIARSASAIVSGNKAVAITTLANATTTATITTTHPHQFRVGQLVTVRGATDANFNVTNVAITTVPSATTFTYTMAGTPASTTIASSQTTTVLVDATKNWTTNQWAGFTVYMYTGATTAASGSTTGQSFRIASNTATTLTLVATATAPTNGVSRYSISTSSAIGAADFGVATGTGSTTTLQDTTKNWAVNIWAGKRLRILTTTGTVTEVSITSNTANTITCGTITAPTTLVTGYAILEQTVKSTGVNINWAFGTSDANLRGRYIFSSRGGAAIGFDRFDLTTDRCNLIFTSPITETLTTGTMTAYDGLDNIFFHKDATQRVMSFNVLTGKVNGGSMYPYTAPTATIGNRMEIFTTRDGLKYLWLNRASFQECFRCLIFW
ncbi:flagellar hook-length control protein [Pseudanabaena phage Pam2]|nr:flagellar hook-length control protein [Pseudanabaena phage Pam2]